MDVSEQYKAVRTEVDRVCNECGRDPAEVTLVAVSKTVDVPVVQGAIDAGCMDFGENRPDELMAKQAAYPQACWHYIGNLQSRRIGDIVPRAHLMHSVYKIDHLPKIEAVAAAAGKVQDILLEVNSGEEAKGGIAPAQASDFVRATAGLAHVRLCGLMTMAPQGDISEAQRCFERLRLLRDELVTSGIANGAFFSELSMGMSEDWPQAIKEGATIIRVGRAVFSEEFA